jgi:NTP pyrophosphatase (non-canonical NTP hydrolase)/uncharacterized protein YdcH (DUF465 family)
MRMQFADYQRDARRTDQLSINNADDSQRVLMPILGLSGEVGQLVSEFKNYLLRKDDRAHFESLVKEELGDILWYLSNVADQFGLKLDDVAFANLIKTQNRWPTRADGRSASRPLFDTTYSQAEQLPRTAIFRFEDLDIEGQKVVRISLAGRTDGVGDKLTDNAYVDDGYRFHDAFHLANAAVLGWSPVLRKLLGCKRKSNADVDNVEDGGRAQVIEEGIAALVFSDARERNLYEDSDKVDSAILRVVKNMTAHLEVSVRSYKEWQKAILHGYDIFRQLQANSGGFVSIDLLQGSIEYQAQL